ncbi:HNH endonuclease [Geodermatophilus saharensis]|uniref:HNH endonuclease n=1 Tax=Geodermatophilus saharensis TaxID=1137994 RepID=UPI0011402329|nr:HNH endonuclease [Geodermatophilus saharensis]
MTEVLAVDEPVVGWASGPLGAVQAADREIGRQTALRARAIAAFAATRPASADRPPGSPGAMAAERWASRAEVLRPVSEWAVPELVVALNLTGGGLADRPRLALTDAVTGALLALTDLPALHRAASAGTDLRAPDASPGYRPGAALDRYVRARDRRCRFPGCRRPVPRHGELDHTTPWPAGPTTAANLAGYCTGHHRSTAPFRVPP